MANKLTALQSAARDGLLETVINLVDSGEVIDEKYGCGCTPLLLAAKHGHKDIIEYLINAGADINSSDNIDKWTLLHYACRNGWSEIVLSLLKKNADIQVKTRLNSRTPLFLAALYGHKDIFEYLINAGADINCSDDDNLTLLHCASESGCPEIVLSLLKKDADMQVKAKNGNTPLLVAAANRHKDIVELLIDAGADINSSDNINNLTLLHYASQNGWPEIVRSLLKKGADIEGKNKHRLTPLLLAADNRHKDIVELLIDAGADINNYENIDNRTILHFASKNGWLEIIRCLMKKGADIQVKAKHGLTPLLIAAECRHKDIVELLIDAGADINISYNINNCTLLHFASKNGWPEIIRCLLKKGADIQVKTRHGLTPLLVAAYIGHKDIVELLINEGADINSFDNVDNCTLLHYASQNGWPEVVHSLLKKSVDIDAKSNKGNTSLQIACNHNKVEIVEQLINAGADVNVESNDGNSPLSTLITSQNIKLIRLLIKSGAYLKPTHYKIIKENSLLKEHILKDIELCSETILNELNHKYLPELYKLPMACKVLPRIEDMRIGNNSHVAHDMMQCVKHEIEAKGHCNVLEVQPINLKMLAAKSFISYCNNVKKQNGASNQRKRSAEFDCENQHTKSSSKIMRCN